MKSIRYKGWVILSTVLVLILSFPIWALVKRSFFAESDIWNHLLSTVVPDFAVNTALIVIGVSLFATGIGVSLAWFVSVYRFPGRKIFSWALMLPLAIPAYVQAYTYAGMFDYTSPVSVYTSEMLGIKNAYTDIMTLRSLVFLLSFNLFPYVYLLARATFSIQSVRLLEAGRTLGVSGFRLFRKVALPITRPALAIGIVLISMELLNDYGAMKYFGINTFTTAICQVWFAFNDINAAVKLSLMLSGMVILFLFIEKWLRGKRGFQTATGGHIGESRRRLNWSNSILVFMACMFTLLIGFIVPTLQLLSWTVSTFKVEWLPVIGPLALNSFKMALYASVSAAIISLMITYAYRLTKSPFVQTLMNITIAGYAIPGAVVAIGLMIPFIFIHNTLANNYGSSYNLEQGLYIGGSIALVIGYVVRFAALSTATINAGFEHRSNSLWDASKVLGVKPLGTLLKISAPLLKTSIVAGAAFVFINVLKEIPLTIILRPFGFETLVTKSFELAKNEQLAESASLSFMIVLLSIIPVLLLNRIFSHRKR